MTLFFALSVCSFVSDEVVCEIMKASSGVVNLLPSLARETRLVSSRNFVTLSNYQSYCFLEFRVSFLFFPFLSGWGYGALSAVRTARVRFLRSRQRKRVRQLAVKAVELLMCKSALVHVRVFSTFSLSELQTAVRNAEENICCKCCYISLFCVCPVY